MSACPSSASARSGAGGGWPYETRAFMRARLNQYNRRLGWLNATVEWLLLSLFMETPDKHFRVLEDPAILTDWQKRFELSGQANPQDAWNRILEKEVTAKDYLYLLSLLDHSLTDVHVPPSWQSLFEKIYRAHIRKEYISPTPPSPRRRCC
jgi:transitional endoplasmic reticulum ATPase